VEDEIASDVETLSVPRRSSQRLSRRCMLVTM
jgi:hypothetical protein